uniref:Nuclear pore complex protein NUP1 n=1 Tax=Populus davidiana TaxID=266767 RepID=A0A6M2EB39_9ROSI
MAAAAGRESNERMYEDRGGYGKFRKRPFRRSAQTTPYDRPSTAIRNPGGISNGWLSKLVDPAQRLIASGAHRLFASVFRKRLPAPPVVTPRSQPPETKRETDVNPGALDKPKGMSSTDCLGVHREAINASSGLINSLDRGGVTELELILKQKTFTRSEIDRLTALLQSRTADFPTGNEEKNPEVISSRAMVFEGKKELLTVPVTNGFESRINSTPIVGSSVLNDDVASPTELAKAYMGSRPSKVSPSMLESRCQPFRDNSTALINHTFTPKSPMMSLTPRSSGCPGVPENYFVTPRSRGRSAIYNMARTPYSRVHASTGLQVAGTSSDAFAGPSFSSQNALESSRFSGSKQGALKRRSSVLDNDIGSVGPIRRIRQKSNLLPTSGTLSIRGAGIGSNAAQKLPSTEKPVLVGEPLKDNWDNNVHGTTFTPVPSKSSEMASKILHQLDVLVSSRENSPAKLSPSMLRGPALRSLENVDSSKFVEIDNDTNKLALKHDTLLPDARESVSQKQDEVEEKGPSKPIAPCGKSALAGNGMDTTRLLKNDVAGVKTSAFPVMSTFAQAPVQKKRAFQMSAQEDFLDLDDDDYSNGTASGMLADGREKVDAKLVEKKTIVAEAVVVEKSPVQYEVNSPSSYTLNKKNAGIDGSMVLEKSIGFTSPAAPLPTITDKQAAVNKLESISDEAALPKYSNALPQIFSTTEKVALPKEPNGTSQFFHFSNKTGDKAAPLTLTSVMSDPSGQKLGVSSDAGPKGFSFTPIATGATELVTRDPGLDKGDDKDSLKIGNSFRTAENVPSTSISSNGSLFSFGITSNSSSLNNGFLASTTPSSFSSPSLPLFSSNVTGQKSSSIPSNSVASSSTNATTTAFTAANTNGNSNFPVSASASEPTSTAASIFKFGSVSSNSVLTVPSITTETTEVKTKETSFSASSGTSSAMTSTTGSIFGGTSAITNAGNNIFGDTTAVTGKENSVFGGTSPAVTSTESSVLNATSAVMSTGSGPFSFNAGSTTSAATNQSQGFNPFNAGTTQVSAAGTGLATSTQSMPMQFSTPASTASSAFSSGSSTFGYVNTAFSSGSSTFGSSTSKLLSSGTTFGLNSSTSESSSVSSMASPASAVFGSNWQAPKSTGFSSTPSSSSSTLFAFGAASNTGTSSAPMVFGSTSSVSSAPFPFSSPASATPSQPVFGAPNPSFGFGSSSGNNDQMSMEDSMAEDTVQATTPSVSVFSQQPATPGSIFGFPAPSGGNQFGSTGPSGANPFQFGSQPNLAAPQNPSFQASGSLEFNAGGSFSLGTGGGDKSHRKIVRVKKTPRKR